MFLIVPSETRNNDFEKMLVPTHWSDRFAAINISLRVLQKERVPESFKAILAQSKPSPYRTAIGGPSLLRLYPSFSGGAGPSPRSPHHGTPQASYELGLPLLGSPAASTIAECPQGVNRLRESNRWLKSDFKNLKPREARPSEQIAQHKETEKTSAIFPARFCCGHESSLNQLGKCSEPPRPSFQLFNVVDGPGTDKKEAPENLRLLRFCDEPRRNKTT